MKLALLFAPWLLLAQADWTVPAEFRAAGYTKTRSGTGYKLSGPGSKGAMTRTVDATPYRGAPVRLRAVLRVEGEGSAQLLLRVDREGGALGFFDNMADRVVRAAPAKEYELTGEVAPDARSIEIGVLTTGAATVVVDGASFEKLPSPDAESLSARGEIEGQYARVDAAYAAGDLQAIGAMAVRDAEVILPGTRLRLSAVLRQLGEQVKNGVSFKSHSTVTAFHLEAKRATVWVNNESAGGAAALLSNNRDVWVRSGTGWRLESSTLIASRPLIPREALDEIAGQAGFPDWGDVRIVLWQGEPPALPGFTVARVVTNRDQAAAAAVAYLEQHAPDEAGRAAVAYQRRDPARMAAVVKAFDSHRAETKEWMFARQGAVLAYQLSTMRREEALAAYVVWLASEPYRESKILVALSETAEVAPLVRKRYGAQAYAVGTLPRELLGGDYFIDVARVPVDSALGRWLAGQKLPFDGVVAR